MQTFAIRKLKNSSFCLLLPAIIPMLNPQGFGLFLPDSAADLSFRYWGEDVL